MKAADVARFVCWGKGCTELAVPPHVLCETHLQAAADYWAATHDTEEEQ